MSKARHATLRDYLTATRVTQSELADLLGVSVSAVSLYVSGKRTPRLGLAVKISRLTGISVERLLGQDSNSAADRVA